MSFALWLTVVLLLLVVGVVVIWITNKLLSAPDPASSAHPKMAQMGYGKERWQRELSLWNGVLRRSDIGD